MTSRSAAIALWVGLLAAHPGAGLAQETESSRATPLIAVPSKGDDLPRKSEAYLDRRDITDLFRRAPAEKAAPEPYVLYPSIIPAIGYNPALGFLIGVVSKAGMLLGDPGDTTMSSASLLVLLTTNRQLVLQLGSTVLTSRNEWMMIGDWRFLLYNQDTYGLSTGTPLSSTSFSISGWGSTTPIDGGQPMKFNLLRFHQVGLRSVWGNLYVGGGLRVDRYFGIVDESLDLAAPSPVVTSHYAYSTYYGFNPGEYTLAGVTLNAVYDSRDSTINAYRGIYAQLALGGFPTWLGSSQASTMVGVDFRAYLGLSDAVPRNVLAFWLLASGVTSGVQPYLTLPSVGWDAAGPRKRPCT